MSGEITKVALITGACGGIGKALVYKYASQGVSLAIADKSLKEVELLVDEIVNMGGTAKAFSGDLTEQSYCDNLPNDVKKEFGKISDKKIKDEMVKDFIDYYGKNIVNESKIIDGVLEFLKWSKQNSISLAVCTNKQEHLAIDLLKKIKIFKSRFFD